MTKAEKMAKNVLQEKLHRFAEIFPECMTEVDTGKGLEKSIDIEMLKVILQGQSAIVEEKYEFNWVGKRQAVLDAYTPTDKKLKLVPEESFNGEETGNLYIEGDNLDVLKLLQIDYAEKVDVIYIDPPYNTGNDFIYFDKFGSAHSGWCSMIYSRLLLARNLMAEDGAIFISIDDNEFDNLKKICNEVFGENNFVTVFSWIKTTNPPSLGSKVRNNLEYVLCYEKKLSSDKKLYGRESNQKDSPLANATNKRNVVTIPAGSCVFGDLEKGHIKKGKKPSGVLLLEDVEVADNRNIQDFMVEFCSKWSQDNIYEELSMGTHFIIKKAEYFSIRYIKGNINYVVPDKFLDYHKFDVRDNEYGRKELEELLGKVGFHYPKNTPLISTLLKMYVKNKKDALIMDFFSGSATTAHAVMKLNAQDGGERQFIMVQLPEECEKNSEAYKAGYRNLCEIGKARIRQAAVRLAEENPETQFDKGFLVYRLV